MAFVVARPKGRFEIRESVHTPKGPRARTLANFATLTDEVLATARRRASRPFDDAAVRAAAVRAAAVRAAAPDPPGPEMRHFVDSSRRMARSLGSRPESGRRDPGEALIDLLAFAEEVTAFVRPPAREPLRFPPLARLVADRAAPSPASDQQQ